MRRTALLVDDEALLRRLLARILGEAGFGVVEAENGEVALAAALRMNGTLDLVVSDIHMPVMNGLELARQLRPLHPAVPILLITGRDITDPAPEPEGFELLRKPFRAEAFLGAIDRMLSARPDSGRDPA
jgi:CheY-like chemotaxis protein